MNNKKKVFAIIGSASSYSTNLQLVEIISQKIAEHADTEIFGELKSLPHFDPELSIHNAPEIILGFRSKISTADAVLICTPEYVFSIPSGLKNAIEWCISTTVFSEKPCGLITASASGAKAHEELQLIMRTAMAHFVEESTMLIQGVRGKIDEKGNIVDVTTMQQLDRFVNSFLSLFI